MCREDGLPGHKDSRVSLNTCSYAFSVQSNCICYGGTGLSSSIPKAKKYHLKWGSLVMVLTTESENLVNSGNDTLLSGFE